METEETAEWVIEFKNSSARKGWEELELRFPTAAERCKSHLRESPFRKIAGCVFPLRGKKNKGKWEYEITDGDRVYYFPNKETKTVTIYYAGTHPKKQPEF